jgi:hypothetical protein
MGKSRSKRKKHPVLSGIVKVFEAVITLMVILAILIAAAGFLPLSHPEIDKLVLNDLSKRNTSVFKVDKIVLTPWLGIELKNLTISKKFKSGDSFYLAAPKIKIAGNIVVLFIRNRDIKKELKELSCGISNIYDRPGQFVVTMMKTFEKMNDINRIAVEGKQFAFSTANGKQLLSRNLVCEIMKKGNKTPGASTIEISAEDAGIQNGLFIYQVRASFDYRRGLLTTTKCKASIYGGSLKMLAVFDLRSDKINKCQLTISDMDLITFYKSTPDPKGNIEGNGDFTINFQPGMHFWDTLKGRGTLDITDLCVTDLPVIEPLGMLFSSDIKSLEFRKFHSNLKFNGDGKTFTESFGNGSQIEIKAVGWISADGKLDQSLEGVFSEEAVGKMKHLMAGSLERTSNNGRSFKCRIYGTLDNPKLELDKATLKKAVGNIFENVKEGLQNIFQ